MAAPLEKTVQRNILRKLNSLPGCRARSQTAVGPYNQAGEPDIDGVLQGRAVKVEVKRSVTRNAAGLHSHSWVAYSSRGATDLQAKTLMEWREAGAVTGVVVTVEEMLELLDWAGWDRRKECWDG